jgi:formate dehydrogenase major subunit/formate dehydrogenase alpha subunit
LGRGASTNSIPEIENDRFILVIGSNTTEAHPVLALRIKKAVRKGATLVVADPRRIWLTKIAKRHLQLRPGTDVWLLNAMMHTILAEGLQDEDYIREHTEGFDEVREVVSRYAPEEAEKATGVPAEAIRETAREYARERHAGIFYTLGITEHACGVNNIWSLANLVLMTGHLGYESTGLNALRGQNNVQGLNDSGANPAYLPGYQPVDDPEIRRKFSEAWGAEVPATPGYRLDQMMSGLHDGRIRALYLIGENPAQTEPNAHHVEEGLAKLEFLVAQDLFLNDITAQHADVVFPASSFAEKDGTFTNTERRVNLVRKAVDCPGEARVDREIVIDVARALGAGWPAYESAEDVWNELAELCPNWYGIRYPRLQEAGLQWPCPDLDHPGTPYLHAPHPARAGGKGKFWPVEFQPPIEEPDSEYPFVLSTGRTLYHYNSATMTMREPGVTDKQEEPFFEIHPDDAQALGLADGDLARLVSRRGELEAQARIGERVYPGLVWMALHFAEAKVNWLTHDVGDSLIGTPEYKVSAVRIEPVRASVRAAAR